LSNTSRSESRVVQYLQVAVLILLCHVTVLWIQFRFWRGPCWTRQNKGCRLW